MPDALRFHHPARPVVEAEGVPRPHPSSDWTVDPPSAVGTLDAAGGVDDA